MARIDHIAFRVRDRLKTVQFLCDALGYHVQQEFPIYFNDEKTDFAMCTALEPPEIFISEGSPGTIVAEWVKAHGPGIHHIAIQVDSVAETMEEWRQKGWAE